MRNRMEQIKILKLFNQSIENKNIDKNILKIILKNTIKKEKLEDYVKKVIFLRKRNNMLGQYNYENKLIIINEYSINKLTKDNILFRYELLFQTIYHELEHAKQHKLVNENYILNILDSSKNFTYNVSNNIYLKSIVEQRSMTIAGLRSIIYYYKNHDFFSHEHEANFFGKYKSLKQLSQLSKKVNSYYSDNTIRNKELAEQLLIGYKINKKTNELISPTDRVNSLKIMKKYKELLEKHSSFNNFEKLLLGLPVKKELYQSIYNDLYLGNLDINFESYIKHI